MTSAASQFWRDRRGWPVKMPGYVFLAEAVNQIGKSRFPVSWVGDEPWIDVPIPLPDEQAQASVSDVRRAHALLGLTPVEKQLPSLPLPLNAKGRHHPPTRIEPLDDLQWAEARLISLEKGVAAAEKRSKWEDVLALTSTLFRMGDLHCYLRRVEGGAYDGPFKPELWNTENTRARFGRCLIDLGRLYTQTDHEPHSNIRHASYSRQDFRLIFVEERSLALSVEAVAKLDPPDEWIADKAPQADGAGPSEGIESESAPAAQRLAFRKALKALIMGSTQVKTKTKAELEQWAKADFGLGSSQTRDARKIVMSELEAAEIEHVWADPGRTKGAKVQS